MILTSKMRVWILAGLLGLFLANLFPAEAITTSGKPVLSSGVYLNPNTGRFWTMDSYAGSNSDPLSLHKYLYAQADPINRVDPSGHNGDLISFNVSTAIATGLAGATYGAYSAHRTGRNVWAGAAIGFAGGFVGGGFFGAVPAAVWGTKAGVAVLATFSAISMNSAINYARAGYYDLAAMDAAFALAPLGLRGAPHSPQSPSGPELGSLDIPQTRDWYHEQLGQLGTLIWELRFNGQSLEAVARFASGTRNLIRIQARALMENEQLAAELDRNNPIQDVEFYIQKYRQEGLTGDDLWNKIIEKALTTNPEVDSLSGR